MNRLRSILKLILRQSRFLWLPLGLGSNKVNALRQGSRKGNKVNKLTPSRFLWLPLGQRSRKVNNLTTMCSYTVASLLASILLTTCTPKLAEVKSSKTDPSYKDASLSPDQRAELLLAQMTLEEKVSQMRMFHANLGIEYKDNKLVMPDAIKTRLKDGIAGIKNPGEHYSPLEAAKLNNALQKYIIENTRLGIPALFVTESYNGVDAEGCTRFARPITLASSFDPALVKRVWDKMGIEARVRGLHMTHSPEVDIVRDPRFGRMSEAFGEDTHLVTEMAVAAVSGIQGDTKGLSNGTHIGAVSKHFAAYGLVAGGRNFAAIEISPRTLIDEIFPPFEAAVKRANTLGIMASHGDINGVASHANPYLHNEVLRKEWGFKGYVVSDANDIWRLNFFMNVAEDSKEAALLGLKAGVDVDLYSDSAYYFLPMLIKTNPEVLPMIDMAAKRMLRTKFILGLFENPYVDLSKSERLVHSEETLKLAVEADESAITLLKNVNNTLPLDPNKKQKIAILGPVLPSDPTAEFKAVAPNSEFMVSKGFDITDGNTSIPKLLVNQDAKVNALVDIAKQADVVILFLGDDEFTAKEAFFNNALGDRADITLLGQQNELFYKIKALGKPVIIAFKHRRTLAINELAKDADAILDLWELSEVGHKSLANIIFGITNPSGKLPVTVPRHIGQLPYHYSTKEINFKKGYLFMENGPLYPFGHGLSYTTFTYNNIRLNTKEMSSSSSVKVSIDITNTGKVAGKEAVQLYLKDVKASVIRPSKELKAFQKIMLNPGETKTVTFEINPEMLKFTTINMKRELEAGEHLITIGPNSAEGLSTSFRLKL